MRILIAIFAVPGLRHKYDDNQSRSSTSVAVRRNGCILWWWNSYRWSFISMIIISTRRVTKNIWKYRRSNEIITCFWRGDSEWPISSSNSLTVSIWTDKLRFFVEGKPSDKLVLANKTPSVYLEYVWYLHNTLLPVFHLLTTVHRVHFRDPSALDLSLEAAHPLVLQQHIFV